MKVRKQDDAIKKKENANQLKKSLKEQTSDIQESRSSDKFGAELFPESHISSNFSSVNNTKKFHNSKQRLTYAASTSSESIHNNNKPSQQSKLQQLTYAAPTPYESFGKIIEGSAGTDESRPGAVRERGIDWDGNENDDDNETTLQDDSDDVEKAIVDQKPIVAFLAKDTDDELHELQEENERLRNQNKTFVNPSLVLSAEPIVPPNAPPFNRFKCWVVSAILIILLIIGVTTIVLIQREESSLDEEGVGLVESQYPTISPSKNPSTSPSNGPSLSPITILGDDFDTSATIIDLSNTGASGTIPTLIGLLTQLTYLMLDRNDISGAIPSELGRLSELKRLWLADNQLIGSIPSELGGLTKLTSFGADNNRITGSIPSELGNLTELRKGVILDRNDLTGSIPSELGLLTHSTKFRLNDNQLTGSIPEELGCITLTTPKLSNNKLNGSIPTICLWQDDDINN